MRKIKLIKFIIIINIINVIFVGGVYAVSTTPTASPSATATPTDTENEKVKELLELNKQKAMEDKLNEIKEKIENKGYVGTISEITDSTIVITNFRGKQRIRIAEAVTIIGANKKEIETKDLAVDDKIIAMGQPDNTETLEAKRIIVIVPPKTTSPVRVIFYGIITQTDSKTSTLSLSEAKNPDQVLSVKIDKTTNLIDQKDPKNDLSFKDFKEGQKLIIVYPQPAEGKTPLAKTIFQLPQ